MRTSDFDYTLPTEQIAQTPIEPRDHSRLMVLHLESGRIEHRRFFEIAEYLGAGDVLVLNDSRVIPARLMGHKSSGAKVEVLLLNRVDEGIWETLAKPGKRLKGGTAIEFDSRSAQGRIEAEVLSKDDNGTFQLRFTNEELLEKMGVVPLPPYVHVPLQDPERYQTVYSRSKGSVAAPTAGLHFTPELMETLEEKGVEFVSVTLHVGLGSFRPVDADDPREHSLHQEYCEIGADAVQRLNEARREAKRIIAVGTTAVRALEWAAGGGGDIQPVRGWNNLYILPGYRFRVIDAMVTNFHLPRSTLLMLVCAFAGREKVLQAYEEATRNGYRFYSFGDGMFVV
ncbi:MAG: tRNA preQ1(34) S-adenosylmethionine ribosyltransferase-isomerase QueA [Dehalococcoidia bacterium]